MSDENLATDYDHLLSPDDGDKAESPGDSEDVPQGATDVDDDHDDDEDDD